MEGTTAFKQVDKFQQYEQKQQTSLAAIHKAYQAASAAVKDARPQYLVSCVSLPHVGRHQQYKVRTQPCGYIANVSTEQVTSDHNYP